MAQWLRLTPGIPRAVFLAAALVAVGFVSKLAGTPVDWEPAVVFGITLGIAMRWPLILPRTGIRVVLMTGLLFEALWSHGFPTALALLLIEFGTRMVALPYGRNYWEWRRPLIVVLCLALAYAASALVAPLGLLAPHSALPRTDAAGFIQAYVFWVLLSASWTFLVSPTHGRSRSGEFSLRIQQTWWVPLSFLLVAWGFSYLHTLPVRLEIPVCLILLWVHYRVAPVFTALYQDRAVAELVRLSVQQSPEQRRLLQRVFTVAYRLARDLQLPDDEVRQIGYAALLQDNLPEPDPMIPLWFLEPPTGRQLEAIRLHTASAAARVEQAGGLEEVARIIRARYASYDGSGAPPLAGDAIPLGAQVLSAANAIVLLSAGRAGISVSSPSKAVEWIRNHVAHRFSPELQVSMIHVFVDQKPAAPETEALPETVKHLRGLMTRHAHSNPVVRSLRRIWYQLRSDAGLASDLPTEVLAVAHMAAHFASSKTFAETAQMTVEAVGKLMGAKVALATVDTGESEVSLRWRATYDMHQLDMVGRELVVQGGFLSRAVLDREPVQVPELSEVNTILAQQVSEREGIRSLLCVPLLGRRGAIGAIIVGMTAHHWFTPREVGLIRLIAGQAAVALENADLMDQLEERLEHISRLKAFTDTLLDNLTSSIVVVDPNGNLLLANAAARSLFGSRYALQPRAPLPEGLQQVCPARRVLEGEIMADMDVAWGPVVLEVQAAPLHDAWGTLLGAVCLARDVTHMRMMEQQVRRIEKLAAVGELAAGAAHEIRNPLTSIRGFIQLVEARAREENKEYIQIILSEIDRIDQIIRDLLLLAKPSDLERAEVSLTHLIEELLLLRSGEMEQKGIVVRREFDPSVRSVLADPRMLRQLLLNLVINAAEAMPRGGLLTISVKPAGPGHIALEVGDTGEGISPENLQRLFVPFFTTKESGTGLGLALCYSIVRAHNGRIDVRSNVGEGTTFVVTLPIA